MARKKVLVADDSMSMRHLVRLMLKDDVDTVEAQDGREAVEVAEREQPDLILLDVHMPNVDGRGAWIALRQIEAFRTTPICFMTALAEGEADLPKDEHTDRVRKPLYAE